MTRLPWIFGLVLGLLGIGLTFVVLWQPTTVHMPMDSTQLTETDIESSKDWWLLWSTVADPLLTAQQETHTHGMARWVPIQAHRTEMACDAAVHTIIGQVLALQDPQFARWQPFLSCLPIGQHPEDTIPLSMPAY